MTTVELAELGPLVVATDVDLAVVATLRTWMPTYIRIFEHERGLESGSLARPKSSAIASAMSEVEFTDKTLPAIVVITPATSGEPEYNPDHSYDSLWNLEVHCVARGSHAANTRAAVARLEGAARRIVLQKGVNGLAGPSRLRWRGMSIARMLEEGNEGRYLLDAVSRFDAWVENSAQGGFAGPHTPDLPPEDYLPGVPIDEITYDVQPLDPGGQP